MSLGRAVLVLAALICLVSACSGAAPGSPGSATAAPVGSSRPVSSIDTGPMQVILAQLAFSGASYDGQTLLVTGGAYYGGNGQQLLCDGFLESYPPQPTGN